MPRIARQNLRQAVEPRRDIVAVEQCAPAALARPKSTLLNLAIKRRPAQASGLAEFCDREDEARNICHGPRFNPRPTRGPPITKQPRTRRVRNYFS